MQRKGMRVVAGLAAVGVLAAACASGGRSAAGDGRDSPRQALMAFLAAAKERDLDAMAVVWGGERGSAARYMPKEERDKRLLIVQCHLQHDASKVAAEYPADGGRRGFRVDLTFRGLTRTTTMLAAQGPNQRWYLESADIEKTSEFCRMGGVGKTVP
jgi:hypothetical protein